MAMNEVINNNNLISKNSFKNNSLNKTESSNAFFETIQHAERKSPSEYKTSDNIIDSASDLLDKNIDFATAMLLAAAKNQGIDDQDGGSKAKEMSDAGIAISTSMGQKAALLGQKAIIESQKNPVIDLMDLKNKIIDYKIDVGNFYGQPVSFNYKVTHNEESSSTSINLIFSIKNKDGQTVKTIKQSGTAGDHQLMWDGTDERGQKVDFGEYKLQIQANGSKKIGDTHISFPVTADTTLTGKVESTKIEKGAAVGVYINGILVTREQIQGVYDIEINDKANYLKPALIGKNVELDFSRAQVKNGMLEVYFNNHIENAGTISVDIYDSSNKFIKTLNTNEKISAGIGKISFDPSEVKLTDGDYNLKLFVNDLTNPVKAKVELNYNYTAKVVGIDYNKNEFKSINEEIFSAYNINSIVADYLSPIEERRQSYFGKEVTYRNDLFEYDGNANDVEFLLLKPQEDGVISYGQMAIYDEVNDGLVQIIESDYKPYYFLDDASQLRIQNYINGTYQIANYDNLNRQQRNDTNFHIENEIKLGNISLQEQFQTAYDQGQALITFPAWNGTVNDSDELAKIGGTFRREFTPIYAREDGSMFAGKTDKEALIASVESVDQEEGDLILNMVGGSRVPEEMIIKVS